jgi:hypothetical protein
VAVDHLGNLLGAHPSILMCKAIEYGFFYFHLLYSSQSNTRLI